MPKAHNKTRPPSATHITEGPVQEGFLIEEGVHTPYQTPPSSAEDNPSSSDIKEARETTVLPSPSQKGQGEETRAPSPKGSDTEAMALEQPKLPLSTSAPDGSEPPMHEIDRTLVISPSKGIRRSEGSPRVEALATNTEALKALTHALTSLQSEIQHVCSTYVSKEELSAALASVMPTTKHFQKFKEDLLSASQSLVTYLIEAGYSNYSNLQADIKRMVNYAIVMGQASTSS
ncbi:hypothetical protein OSB04_019640 [Centaurea solstitialis]|uniref:Uncharacterized protein n=1 Tax=Centaurea solstitialis TaxID=347529 RepID=A0AA38W577_9ASTR|nr:hypothetical protein OSB04_019640 [Centaurea solstitialis]